MESAVRLTVEQSLEQIRSATDAAAKVLNSSVSDRAKLLYFYLTLPRHGTIVSDGKHPWFFMLDANDTESSQEAEALRELSRAGFIDVTESQVIDSTRLIFGTFVDVYTLGQVFSPLKCTAGDKRITGNQ